MSAVTNPYTASNVDKICLEYVKRVFRRRMKVSVDEKRLCGVVMRSTSSVCLYICPVWALTFESVDLEPVFWYVDILQNI